eukprot:225652-Amphidinium_carterae.1
MLEAAPAYLVAFVTLFSHFLLQAVTQTLSVHHEPQKDSSVDQAALATCSSTQPDSKRRCAHASAQHAEILMSLPTTRVLLPRIECVVNRGCNPGDSPKEGSILDDTDC